MGLSLAYPFSWRASHTNLEDALEALTQIEEGISRAQAEEYRAGSETAGVHVVFDAAKPKRPLGEHRPASVRVMAAPIPTDALESDGSCDAAWVVDQLLQGAIEGARELPFVTHVGEAPALPQYPDIPGLNTTVRIQGVELHRRSFLFLNAGMFIDVSVSWSDPVEERIAAAIAASIELRPTADACVWPGA